VRRRLWVFLALSAVLLAACGDDGGGGGGGDGGATGGEGLIVGISWNNYAQPRWAKADGPAIIEAVEAAGGSVIETDANDSSEQQLADVDSLIAQGADALIILAKDAAAILPAVQKATEAGIPVIGYDRLIEDTNAFYITFNNEQVGTIMAEEVTAVVPEGNYAIVKGHSADPNVAMKDDAPALGEINMGNSVYSTPIVADNVLYIANRTHLFAIEEGAEPVLPAASKESK